MKHVRLHGLRQALDAHRYLPRRIAQAKCRLDAGELAWEKCCGDFGQIRRPLRRETETRIR